MQCKEGRRHRTESNGFCDMQEYIEKLRGMIQDGTINLYKAAQMLDEEMSRTNRFKEFYCENRMKIIDSLFL